MEIWRKNKSTSQNKNSFIGMNVKYVIFPCRILQENRELFNLYKDLVTTNVVTADEFWQNYAGDVNRTCFTFFLISFR